MPIWPERVFGKYGSFGPRATVLSAAEIRQRDIDRDRIRRRKRDDEIADLRRRIGELERMGK